MNTTKIKIIACISMLIDHATYLFVPAESADSAFGDNPWYLLGRALGRPAFILFAFLLVEAFFNTEDRKKYIIRLLGLAVVAEPVFDFMCGNLNINHFLDHQNVVFQFLIGIGTLCMLEAVRLKYFLSNRIYYNIFSVAVCITGFAASYYLKVDYGVVGLALILIFYFLRGMKKSALVAMVIVWSLGCIYMEHMLEWAGLPALILICKYNGERGKNLKWFFYIFYPGHMLILVLIKLAVFGI